MIVGEISKDTNLTLLNYLLVETIAILNTVWKVGALCGVVFQTQYKQNKGEHCRGFIIDHLVLLTADDYIVTSAYINIH